MGAGMERGSGDDVIKRYSCSDVCKRRGYPKEIQQIKTENCERYACSLGNDGCSMLQIYRKLGWLKDANSDAHKEILEKLNK